MERDLWREGDLERVSTLAPVRVMRMVRRSTHAPPPCSRSWRDGQARLAGFMAADGAWLRRGWSVVLQRLRPGPEARAGVCGSAAKIARRTLGSSAVPADIALERRCAHSRTATCAAHRRAHFNASARFDECLRRGTGLLAMKTVW